MGVQTSPGRITIGRSVAAVLLGFVANAVLSLIFDSLVAYGVPGAFEEEELRYNPPWDMLVPLSGFPIAMVGGYVAAWHARTAELAHALALAALTFVMWIGYVLMSPPEVASSHQSILQVAGVIGVLVGGGLRALQRTRRRES